MSKHTEDNSETQYPSVERGYRFAILPEWILYHTELDSIDKVVYAILDRHNGTACFPSHRTIGEKINRSNETVRRSIANLESVGAVLVESRFKDGRQTSNLYRLAGDTPFRPVSPSPSRPNGDVAYPLKYEEGVPLVNEEGDPLKNEEPVTRERRTREEIKPTYRKAVFQLPVDMGADPDREKGSDKKLAPSREIVDVFMTSWHALLSQRPEYGIMQRVPHRAAAYKWLNTQYFKPSRGTPRTVEEVKALVNKFMEMVISGEISPKSGMSAWSWFIYSINKCSEEVETTYYGEDEVISSVRY